jgi:hypothetical protein
MAGDRGLVIHCAEQGSDSVRFKVISSDDHSGITTYWVASMGRKIVWSEEVRFTGSAWIDIPVRGLRNGLLQVSVFNQNHDLVAERLLKIRNSSAQIQVKTDHKTYHSRQRVNLSFEFTGTGKRIDMTMLVALNQLTHNPLMVHFKDVAQSFLCDTTYIQHFRPELITDADLLTTTFRPLNWGNVLMQTASERIYSRQDGITGRVYDKKNNLSQHAKVRVTHIPNYKSYETKTDETGTFHVGFGSDIIDLNYLNVDAYDALGKVNLNASFHHEYVDELRNILIGEGESSDRLKVTDIVSYGEPDLIFALRYGPRKFRSLLDTKKKYDPIQYAGYTNVLDIIHDISLTAL